ncbi:MAG: DUF1638 domain-containing protein [Deltaproteobacteria bacterium]|jgi:hypothetical protein|nr:DUF1638 domain-containing protein [Deltaproteobacteria bacterium]
MTTFIGCDVFREELESILARRPEIKATGRWIKAGLHNDLGILEKRLREAIDEQKGAEDLRLFIGFGCLPQLPEMASKEGFPLLKVKNCMEALLGPKRLAELEQNRTMVITPSWLRKTWFAEDGIRAMLGWDDVDFRQNFGRYDRILVLDPGLDPLSDMEILEAFEVIQVPIEVEPLPLEHFEEFAVQFLS